MREKHEGKDIQWDDYLVDADIENLREFYFGGLESIGFGRTNVTVKLTEAVEGAAKV